MRFIKNAYYRGVHSEIPLCCIVWYILRSKSGWVKIISRPKIYPYWEVWARRNGCQYIRCPICALRKRKVQIHMCTKKCRGMRGANANRKEGPRSKRQTS